MFNEIYWRSTKQGYCVGDNAFSTVSEYDFVGRNL